MDTAAETPPPEGEVITRELQMRRLFGLLTKLTRMLEQKKPELAIGHKLQCIHAIVNLNEAIEKLRSAQEKSEPKGITVTEEQVARLIAAIRET